MSIFKDTFRDYVRDQLSIREKLIEIGNLTDNNPLTNRRQINDIFLQSGKKASLSPDSYYQYTLNKQCGIRLTSLVDYVEDVNLGLSNFTNLQGPALSERFILEGGTLGRGRSKSDLRGGIGDFNSAYGDPFIASDASSDGFGVVPMPGIIDTQVRTKSAYGSLREAKVNFECHNRRQLEVLEMLYMRPGYVVLLEWGSTPYINNRGTVVKDLRLVESEEPIYTNNITQTSLYNAINRLKEESCGNYDGFLGFIKNFGFQAREDGGFSCYTELITIGEVIEGLKPPSISPFSPIFLSPKAEDIPAELLVPSPIRDSAGRSELVTQQQVEIERQTGIKTSRYQEALDIKLIPEYNGLEGVTKALKTYTSFNQFTLGNPGPDSDRGRSNNLSTLRNGPDGRNLSPISRRELDIIFPELTEYYSAEAARNPDSGIPPEERERLDYFEDQSGETREGRSRLQNEGHDRINQLVERKRMLEGLLRTRSFNIENTLLSTLGLNSRKELRNFIIPRGGLTKETTNFRGNVLRDGTVETPIFRNDQPFIRWDALVILINNALIPQNENQKSPINLTTERIYDLGKDSDGKYRYRLDALRYAPITEIGPDDKNRIIYDFSSDPNTCILPSQFFNVPPLFIEEQLGYTPNLFALPDTYAEALYGKQPTEGLPLSQLEASSRIGSIFLNINMIDDIASKNNNNPNYTLGNFITDIWDEVNKACPNHNFVLTDDKEANTLFIIDLPIDKDTLPPPPQLHEFTPFSNKTILRNFSYTSNVPSALTATVAIQAQDPRSIQDIDGVTFAAFNRAIKNRLFSIDTESNWVKTAADVETTASEYEKKRAILSEELSNFRFNFFYDLSAEPNERDYKAGNIIGILKEYQQMTTYVSEAKNKSTSFASVIPLEFNATLDGISGIVIGNLFRVEESRLPRAYAKSDIGFIVFSEEQKITAGGDWTTDISGKMVLLDPTPPSEKLPIVNIPIEEETIRDVSFGFFPNYNDYFNPLS